MKTIALLSGGKDSILAMLMAYRYGHEPAVIVNIVPVLPGDAEAAADASEVAQGHEIDSYMYQTVGFEAVDGIAACLKLPLRRACVRRGRAKDQSLLYSEHPPEEDEVESLFRLLQDVKAEFPEVQGLTSGAILSNYQRNRVEFICDRLGIESLAYLWMRQPSEILDMAHELAVTAILVKTASIGLMPRKLIGKTLEEARPTLERMTELYQSHLAGEGGEYETTVLNCPLFHEEQLTVTSLKVVMQDENDISPSGHGVLTVARQPKPLEQRASEAAVLCRLRDGHSCFPSDVLPLLQSLSSPPTQREETRSWSSEACGASASTTHAPFSLLRGAPRPGVESRVFLSSSQLIGSEDDAAIRAAVEDCMEAAQTWAAASSVTPFYFHVSLPYSSWEAATRATYSAKVSHVCPPGLVITVNEKDSGSDGATDVSAEAMVMEVLAAPSATIQHDVLHAQSRSCWALGEWGPYAQARRIGLSNGDALVFVGATPGRVPATRSVATAHDLPFDSCRQGVAALVPCDDLHDVAAEFLFAMANCQSYLALYRHTLHDVTRATVLVTNEKFVIQLPLLWRWCVGATAAPFAQVCTVAVVDGLSTGENIRITMECLEACDE